MSDFSYSTNNLDSICVLVHIHPGVVVRSLFYLLYWEKHTQTLQSNFSNRLDAAVGGTTVEVSPVTLLHF